MITSMISRRTLLTSGAAFAASLAMPSANAQAWPAKPVRVLVGFAAGGNIDNLARVTCARLSEVFKQQFVVENRVGAMGTIAAATSCARRRTATRSSGPAPARCRSFRRWASRPTTR